MTFKLKYREDEKREEQIWLLAERVDFSFPSNEKSWPIVRIVNDQEEAYSFITHKISARVFPMQVGYKWVYAWDDMEVTFEVLRTEKSGEAKVFVVRRTIGQSSLDFRLAIEKDGVYIHQEGTKTFEPPLKQFAFDAERKYPNSKPQDPWSWRGTFAGKSRTEHFENLELSEVTVPAGSYFVIGVRQSNPNTGDEATFWLAHGVGVVKLSGKSESLADDPQAGKVAYEWRLKSFDPGKK